MRARSWAIAVMAAAVALPGVLAGPAAATTGVPVTVTGTGTISPGLTTSPSPESWTFDGMVTTTVGLVDGISVAASSHCNAAGTSSINETQAHGAGTGSWACSAGVLSGRTGTLLYVRAGADVTVELSGDLDGQLDCAFLADQTPPANVTTFHLTCSGSLEAV